MREHISNISSDKNHNKEFSQTENIIELSHKIPYTDSSNSQYNCPITYHAVISIIIHCIRNLSPQSRPYPTHHAQKSSPILNRISHCPPIILASRIEKCNCIVPILKSNSNSTLPNSYHPISLTSVLGKHLEKIPNRQLVWFLSIIECGSRKNRSTSHALFNLQTQIKLAFSQKNSDPITIFFDMEKAYKKWFGATS